MPEGMGDNVFTMYELTARQAEILDFIRRHLAEEGRPPTRPELARAFDLGSTNGVQKHLIALAAKGAIELVPNRKKVRAIELPLLGRVAAGHPIEAIEGDDCIEVPESLVRRRESYVLRVVGDSMIDPASSLTLMMAPLTAVPAMHPVGPGSAFPAADTPRSLARALSRAGPGRTLLSPTANSRRCTARPAS